MGSYGMPLFGLLVPWPPPYALWALMAIDIACTAVPALRPRGRWMLALIALSAYLAYAGLWSLGFIFLILGVVQLGLLLKPVRSGQAGGP